MPTKKQRRRREKDRRHEWEYVYVDSEGHEVEVEAPTPDEKPTTKADGSGARPAAKGAARNAGGAKSTGARAARTIPPPSWNRVLKRTGLFAPLMFIVVYYLGRNGGGRSVAVALYYTAVMLLIFIPFTYMVDSMMYRSYRKRIGDPLPSRERKPKSKSKSPSR